MRKRLFKYSMVFSAFLLLIACSKAPKGILSEKKMKDVMVDVHIAESMINSNYKEYADTLRRKALIRSVFEKHNITQAVYDSSLIWYGKNLDVLMQVYDLALADVNARIRDLGDVQAAAAPSSNQDSTNIWPRRDFLTLYPRALFNGVPFEIRPDRHYPSGSIFVLNLDVWGVTPRMPHKPQVRIAIDQADTVLVVNQTIERDGPQQVVLRGVATKQVRSVYGFIRMDNTDTAYYKVYLNRISLIRYNYGSPSFAAKPDSLPPPAP